jgi:hypothetical protein
MDPQVEVFNALTAETRDVIASPTKFDQIMFDQRRQEDHHRSCCRGQTAHGNISGVEPP